MKRMYFIAIAMVLSLCTQGLAQRISFSVSPLNGDGSEDVSLDINTESDSRTIIQAELYAWYEDVEGNNYGRDDYYTEGGKTQLTLSINWNLWHDNPDAQPIMLHYEYYVLYSDGTIDAESFSTPIVQ